MNCGCWKAFFICCFLVAQTAYAAGEHEIDQKREICREKAYSTMEMIECERLTYDLWDKELNIIYQKVMKELDPDTKTALREAQRRWITFRDAEFKAISIAYSKDEGSIWAQIRLQQRTAIVRDRVFQLKAYSIDLSGEEGD